MRNVLSQRLRARATLKSAWAHIKANGASKTASRKTRGLVHEYGLAEDRNLERLQERLRTNTFRFLPGTGVPIKKPGKSTKRPLLVFDIESRIVQRAILEIVKDLEPIAETLRSGYNFGGIEGEQFGNRAAVLAASAAFRESGHFIRSDIKAFFDTVSREDAVAELTNHVNDEWFIHMIEMATKVELLNHHALGDDRKYFPTDDYGLAQGSCLSPLLCNLALNNFDSKLNRLGCRCIRFVDDFVLFAADRRRAHAAFKAGQQELLKLGLSAYDPGKSDKAEEGSTSANTLTFLGCYVRGEAIRPTRFNCKALLRKIDEAFAGRHVPLGEAIMDANRVLIGWGNSFGFCNDEQAFDNLDREVQKRAERFLKDRTKRLQGMSTTDWLTLAGLNPLVNRRRNISQEARPISPTVKQRTLPF